jgi:hypothetical protein
MSSNWTHPVCDPCWNEANPGREPCRFQPEARVPERCCACGIQTSSGIYVRADPGAMRHHTQHE